MPLREPPVTDEAREWPRDRPSLAEVERRFAMANPVTGVVSSNTLGSFAAEGDPPGIRLLQLPGRSERDWRDDTFLAFQDAVPLNPSITA